MKKELIKIAAILLVVVSVWAYTKYHFYLALVPEFIGAWMIEIEAWNRRVGDDR